MLNVLIHLEVWLRPRSHVKSQLPAQPLCRMTGGSPVFTFSVDTAVLYKHPVTTSQFRETTLHLRDISQVMRGQCLLVRRSRNLTFWEPSSLMNLTAPGDWGAGGWGVVRWSYRKTQARLSHHTARPGDILTGKNCPQQTLLHGK